MKKTVILLTIILLFNAVLCACSGSSKKNMDNLEELTEKILKQTEYLYTGWNASAEILKTDDNRFDINKIADATGYSVDNVIDILQKEYGKDDTYDVTKDHQAYIFYSNKTWDVSGQYALERQEAIEFKGQGYYTKKYNNTRYNLSVLCLIHNTNKTFSNQKTDLQSLKGKIKDDECIKLISDLLELNSLNDELYKKCNDPNEYLFIVNNKNENEAKAAELIENIKSLKLRIF